MPAVNFQVIWILPFKYGIFSIKALRGKSHLKIQVFTECKLHKLLKASQTRWLSLEACVNRLLEQYEALLSHFWSTEESATVSRITESNNEGIPNVS